jgi:flavin-dependent dehydrogenase
MATNRQKLRLIALLVGALPPLAGCTIASTTKRTLLNEPLLVADENHLNHEFHHLAKAAWRDFEGGCRDGIRHSHAFKDGFITGFADQPDWLIDGTGRARLFARTLGIGAQRGGRNDVAHFAHFEGFDHDEVEPGQVIISVLENGWSWRIPLQDGKLSVGVVINKDSAKRLGDTPEQRLENVIDLEPLLREKGRFARRVTDVMTYTNYQLISELGHGKGWIMLGDAFGFVDPMLSPGLFMALESASLLDELVFSKLQPNPRHLDRYCDQLREWHRSWQELIEYFYDGRILRMHEAGSKLAAGKNPLNPAKFMERHMSRVIASMASGTGTRSAYNRNLLKHSTRHLIWGVAPA